MAVEVIDLGLKREPAPGEAAQRELGGGRRIRHRARPQRGADVDEFLASQPAHQLSDGLGGRHDERFDLTSGLNPGLHRAAAGDAQSPDHLDLGVTGLRSAAGSAGQDRSGGGLGVDGVGLADPAAGGAVRAVDLDHGQPVVGQEPQQPGAIAASAFQADLDYRAEGLSPGGELGVAAHRRRKASGAQHPTGLVQHRRDVHVLVRVDPDGHVLVLTHAASYLLH